MPQQKLPEPDVPFRYTARTKQNDDLELLVATAEVDPFNAGWLVDHRIDVQSATRRHAS